MESAFSSDPMAHEPYDYVQCSSETVDRSYPRVVAPRPVLAVKKDLSSLEMAIAGENTIQPAVSSRDCNSVMPSTSCITIINGISPVDEGLLSRGPHNSQEPRSFHSHSRQHSLEGLLNNMKNATLSDHTGPAAAPSQLSSISRGIPSSPITRNTRNPIVVNSQFNACRPELWNVERYLDS